MAAPSPASEPRAHDSPKAERILDSALSVFCQYGFRKTSMQNIAAAAGVSRAALYLHFANKEDVFRAGSLRAHAAARQAVDAALAQQGDIFHRAQEALTAYFGGLMAEIAASPHGPELFDANLELVGSVVRDTRAAVHASLAAALARADTDGEIDLAAADATGDELAAVLLATGDGLKQDTLAAIPLATGIALQLRALRSGIARRDRR